MFTWIAANLSTIIVSAVLIAIVALVIFSMVKNKRTGGSSCGCGCSECGMGIVGEACQRRGKGKRVKRTQL